MIKNSLDEVINKRNLSNGPPSLCKRYWVTRSEWVEFGGSGEIAPGTEIVKNF